MSLLPRSTPKTNIPNTPITYFNPFAGIIVASGVDRFLAALFDSTISITIQNLAHNIPYDCVIRNAEIDIVTNTTTSDTTLIITLDGAIPILLKDQCIITIPAGAAGIGKFTSEDTFVVVPEGVEVAWQLSPVIGGLMSVGTHLSVEVYGT